MGKLVPFIGGVISGVLTFTTFKPAANNLKNHLNKLPIADVEFFKQTHDDVIDVDFSDVDLDESSEAPLLQLSSRQPPIRQETTP